jgi:hypothetical protein
LQFISFRITFLWSFLFWCDEWQNCVGIFRKRTLFHTIFNYMALPDLRWFPSQINEKLQNILADVPSTRDPHAQSLLEQRGFDDIDMPDILCGPRYIFFHTYQYPAPI